MCPRQPLGLEHVRIRKRAMVIGTATDGMMAQRRVVDELVRGIDRGHALGREDMLGRIRRDPIRMMAPRQLTVRAPDVGAAGLPADLQ
jgi:hypothetical protein